MQAILGGEPTPVKRVKTAPVGVVIAERTEPEKSILIVPPKELRPWAKRSLIAITILVAVAAAAIASSQLLSYVQSHESTDDAYTTAHIHPIATRIDGTVQNVLIDDNEHVKAGQLLVKLDPAEYQVKVDQALAALKNAQDQAVEAKTSISLSASNATGKNTEAAGTVDNAIAMIAKAKASAAEAQSAIPQSQAELAQKQAEERRAATDYQRYQQLAQQGAVSIQQRDQALRDYVVAAQAAKATEEGVNQARQRAQEALQAVNSANAQLSQSKGLLEQAKAMNVQTQVTANQYQVAQAAVQEAQTALQAAQLQLSYTDIYAPTTGRVGKRSVEEGQRVQPGQQLFDLVSDDVWVVANFKETQLERMRPGQPVEVTIDSFPTHKFTGQIDSLSPGSGSTFALLPPENATGNFTKIVQRVPVKIVFDQKSIKGYEQLVVPGMSAVVNVTVGRK